MADQSLVPSHDPDPAESALARLATAGERVGWTFHDRRRHFRDFPEARPDRAGEPPPITVDVRAERGRLARAITAVILVGAGFTAVFAGSAGLAGRSSMPELQGRMRLLAVVLALVTVGGVVIAVRRYRGAVNRPATERLRAEKRHEQAVAGYERRREKFEERERRELSHVPEWSAVSIAGKSRFLDVVGGNVWGWEALLTVYGGSLLGQDHALVVLDLSGQAACRELVRLAAAADVSREVQLLRPDATDTDLLAGLSTDELIKVLVESINAPALFGTPSREESARRAATRDERSLDSRILRAIAGELGPDITVERLWAGVRRLLTEPTTDLLSDEERLRLSEHLFGSEYYALIKPRLPRLEAALEPLRHLRPRATPGNSTLTCFAMPTDDVGTDTDLLPHLVVQWLTRRIVTTVPPATPGNDAPFTVILVGADDITPPHLRELADQCERRGIRLVTISRTMGGSLRQGLGRGLKAFMRLGTDADDAASYIGHGHKFVLSQQSTTVSGEKSHAHGTSTGHDEAQGRNSGQGQSGDYHDILALSRNWSADESRTWNVSRTWGSTRQETSSIGRSEGTATNRVYELMIEPSLLRGLPDYGMVLVEHGAEPIITAVDCNPDLATIPAVSMEPYPEVITRVKHSPWKQAGKALAGSAPRVADRLRGLYPRRRTTSDDA
ncbi:hypothetical protein [Actinoplanes sp. NPDC049265]|uniref:hypothetical protein n=1 Tax=Actinoplanes sp. NPDC049265 TaxID=3363902 RepID=UPI00370FD422